VDNPIVLKKHRKAVVIPAGDGGLTYGRMLFDGGAEVLLDVGHRAAALGRLHGRRRDRQLVIHDQGFSHGSAAGCAAAKQGNEHRRLRRGLHGRHLRRLLIHFGI